MIMKASKETLINIEDINLKQSYGVKSEINILCLDLTNFSHQSQFLLCTVSVFIFYLVYGYFLEHIFSSAEVKPISFFITLVQFVFTFLLSYMESMIRNPIKRKVPIPTYALIAALTLGTNSFSNLALSYLNYPTQLIFKSCKLIPVMIGSIIIMKKSYGFLDYVATIFMCIGLTMFTLADSNTSPNFNLFGVIVISLALMCDAVIGNVQEKAMKQYQASNNEVVFYSYAIGSFYLLILTGVSGTLKDGFNYCAVDPVMNYFKIFMLSMSGYVGLQAVLTLVRISGATAAVTVTTMRKAFSIVLSFLLFSKPFVFQYAWSGMIVAFAIYLNHYSKKHPRYVPTPVVRCWQLIKSYYSSEKRYLQLKRSYYDI